MASASVVYVYALVLLLLSVGALAQQKEKITQQQQQQQDKLPGGYDDAIQVGVTRPGAAMAGLRNLTLTALQAAPLAALEELATEGDRFSAPSSRLWSRR